MFVALVGRLPFRAAPPTAAERATVSMDGAAEYMRKYREDMRKEKQKRLDRYAEYRN